MQNHSFQVCLVVVNMHNPTESVHFEQELSCLSLLLLMSDDPAGVVARCLADSNDLLEEQDQLPCTNSLRLERSQSQC